MVELGKEVAQGQWSADEAHPGVSLKLCKMFWKLSP